MSVWCCLLPIRYKVRLTLDDTSDTSDNYITHHKTINRPGFIIATCFSPPAAAINRTKKKIVLVLIARKDVLSSAIHCPFGNKEIINNFDLNDFLTKI